MSKILAQGMITLTQLYEGVQVILSPTAVLIPCDSEENPKSNAYINASTNVKAFLGTMDITSGITLGELEYSDSTVKASKTGTKVSITAITTRTGYVDIPVSATINGETIDLGKHRFNFVKQIDGQPGIPGDPGFGYTLNIKGGVRGVAYAANGTNPEPKTSSQFSVELLKNGVKVANPASISWTCGGNLSGSSSVATFTPTIKSTYNSESSYVRVSVKEFAASLAVEETIPIICTKHADGLDWINEWNNQYVQVGTEKIITPKIFAGTKSSANELTGVAIGRDVLGGNANKVIGIVGYKKNTPVFSLDQDANFFVSSSGSAGDVKNGTNNAKGLYFDGNDLYISGRVRMNGGSTIGANNTSVEEVINNSNLGAQANNKIDNLSIGGNNLLRNGNFVYGMENWSIHDMNSGGTAKSVTVVSGGDWVPVGKKSIQIYGTNTTDRYGVISSTMKLIPNTKYTISGYCAGHRVNKIQVNVRDAQNSHANIHTININPVSGGSTLDKWHRFETTFTTSSNSDFALNLYSVNLADNGYVWFCDVQIQQGTKATAWTPCSEDVNSNINDVKNSLSNFQTTVNTTFKDGIIEEAEAKAIAQHLKTLDAEKADIDKEYTAIYSNTYLTGTAKTNLSSAKSSYDSAHASLKSTINTAIADGKVTTSESASVTSTFNTYNTQLGVYKQRVQEALDNISSGKVDNIQIGGRNLATSTNQGTTGWNWGLQTGGKTISEVTENGIRCCKMVRDNVASTGWSYISYSRIGRDKYLPNKQYTVSFEVKSSVATDFWCSLKEGNSSNPLNVSDVKATVSKANTWTKLSFTLTTKDTLPTSTTQGVYLASMNSGTGVTYIFRNLMIEEGTKASSWSPAPEDIDNNITDVKNSLSGFQNTVNTTFKDGIIEQAEAKAIARHIQILDTEKVDVDKEYSTIYNNSALSGSAKTNLASAKTEFDNAHTSLKSTINTAIADGKVTSSEKTSVDNTFSTYNSILGTYKQRVQEALDAISSAKVNNIQVGGRNLWRFTKEYDGTKYNGWVDNNNGTAQAVAPYTTVNGFGVQRIANAWYDRSQRVAIEANANYTLSAWIKWENTAGSLIFYTNVGTMSGTNVTSQVGTTDYKRVSITFNSGNATVSTCRFECDSNTPYLIYGLKLEKGNKATDWSPAPEDIDNNITDVKNSLSGFQNTVNTTFKDGIIEQAEAKAIARHIQILDTEKADVDKEYSTIYNNSALRGTAKTNLASAKTEFDNAHTSLKSTINTAIADGKVTSSEKTSVDSTFSTYNSILGTYRQRVQEALDNISSGKVDKVEVGGRNYLQNSNFANSLNKWAAHDMSNNTGINKGISIVKGGDWADPNVNTLQIRGTNVTGRYGVISSNMTLVANTTYTISGYCAGHRVRKIQVNIRDRQGSDANIHTVEYNPVSGGNSLSKYYKFETTFTTTSNTLFALNLYAVDLADNGYAWFANVKLEKGNKASDWAPAPEDIDAEISAVNNKADNAQSTANTANNTANAVNTTVNNNKNNWSNAYNRVKEWAQGAVTGSTNINGGMIATDTITAKQMAIGDFNNYSQLAKGKNLVSRYGTANWIEGTNSHSYWQTTNEYFPFTVNETLNPFKAGDKIQIKFDAYTPSTRNVGVGVWFYSDTAASAHIGSVTANVSCSSSWGTKTVNLTLPTGNTYVQNAKSIAILIINGSSGERIEVRNATVNRLVAGDLIVNGTITTDHIHTNGLNANVIKAGTISADRLDANTIVSKVNGGTTEINGNRIQTGTLSASKITTGTLDATKVSVTNLNASNITSGTLGSGGYNLIKNGCFLNDKNHWRNWGSATTSVEPSTSGYEKSLKIVTTGVNQGLQQDINNLQSGKTYTVSAYVYVSSGVCALQVHNNGSYPSVVSTKTGTWEWLTNTFKASSTSVTIQIGRHGGGSNGTYYYTAVMLQEGSIKSAYSPHPNEIYGGITAIDKDGITVTASNVKSKTSMSANGFKITKTDTNEDVFKVNSDGTLVIKGNITVTGGSIPTSNLSGTISSSQLNSSITNDINTAKNTANTAKNTADSVNNTLNSNKVNWNNAYERVRQWASGAITGSTTINGGMITANTISVNKLAVGDFTNLSQIDENLAPNGNTVITHSDNYKYFRFGNDSSAGYHALQFATLNGGTFKVGDRFKFTFIGFGNKSISTAFIIRAIYTDKTWNNLGSASYTFDTANKTRTVELQITSGLTAGKTLQRVQIFNEFSNTTGLVYMRNICINRMATGELIVDGSIKTSMIHSDGLNASVIKAGTISADRLDANTIVSKVNGGTTEINGNRIQTGTLSANKITTGTLDANKVNVTNIKAGNIVSGTIDASKISVTNLNASNITSGTLRGGGYNLLRNSGFKNEKNYWHEQKHNNPTGGIFELISSSATWGYPDASVKAAQIKLSNQSSIEYGIAQNFNTTIGKQYTLTFQYAGHRISGANAIIRNPNGTWLANKSFTPTNYNGGNGSVNNWGTYSLTFTATATSHTLNIVITSAQNDGYLWVAKPQIVEGAMTLPYSQHPNEIYDGSTIIDSNGLTVNNGAIKIKNKAGNTVLSGDSNGNLTLNGTIKSEAGSGQYVALSSGGITFRDSQKNEEVLRIGTSFSNNNRDINGVTFAMPQYSDRISFKHIAKPSLENGWNGSETTYSFMDMWSTDYNHPNGKSYKGINVFAPMYLNQKIRFRNGGDQYLHEVTPNITWNNMNKLMGIYGDNGTVIGCKSADNLHSRIVVTESNHPETSDWIKSWGNWNCSGYTVHNATFNGRYVNSYANTETRTVCNTAAVMTEGNQVRVNFENVQIKDGKAILSIPKRYRGINEGYIIASIVKKGRGDVWVSEEEEERFIIEAENDIKINIEIIIKLTEAVVTRTLKHEDSICYEVPNKQPEGDCC